MNTPAPAAAPAPVALIDDAIAHGYDLRSAITLLRLAVADVWQSPQEADRARNAIDWLANRMEDSADALLGVLDRIGTAIPSGEGKE